MSVHLRAVRGRLGFVLVVAMLGAAAASVFSLLQDEKYSASAKLSAGTDRRAVTKLEIASRKTIARQTKRRLEGRGDIAAAEAVSSVEVKRHGGPDRIEIEATAGSPRTAARVANTFADEYVAFRRDVALRIRSLKERSQDLNELASLQAPNAAIVERATPPGSPSSPRPVRNVVVGAFAGLLLGLGLVLVGEKLDRRLRDPRDLEEAFGLPVLAKLPESDALRKRFGSARDLPSQETAAFGMLRASLNQSVAGREVDSVLITSAAAEDGRSTVAFNLAADAAAAGLDVLLVEADVRRPSLARSLGLPANGGLISALSGEEARIGDLCHELLLAHDANGGGFGPTLDILPAGQLPANAGDLLESERMREVIREARQRYSLVVIDTSPAGMVSNKIPLVGDVSAVIVVGRVGKLTGEQADRLRNQLEKIDAPTLGLVTNFADLGNEGQYSARPMKVSP